MRQIERAQRRDLRLFAGNAQDTADHEPCCSGAQTCLSCASDAERIRHAKRRHQTSKARCDAKERAVKPSGGKP